MARKRHKKSHVVHHKHTHKKRITNDIAWGIASIVCGILAFFMVPILLGPLAIYFGYRAIKTKTKNGRVLGVIGTTLGIVIVVLLLVLTALILL